MRAHPLSQQHLVIRLRGLCLQQPLVCESRPVVLVRHQVEHAHPSRESHRGDDAAAAADHMHDAMREHRYLRSSWLWQRVIVAQQRLMYAHHPDQYRWNPEIEECAIGAVTLHH
jgi:hypothetical protein